MGKEALLIAALSCASICNSRGYDFHTKYKSYCLCADRYELDGSWEMPWILRWDFPTDKPEEEKQEEIPGPRWEL